MWRAWEDILIDAEMQGIEGFQPTYPELGDSSTRRLLVMFAKNGVEKTEKSMSLPARSGKAIVLFLLIHILEMREKA